MELLTLLPGLALAAGIASPTVRRVLSRHAVVANAQRTLEQSRMVRVR